MLTVRLGLYLIRGERKYTLLNCNTHIASLYSLIYSNK